MKYSIMGKNIAKARIKNHLTQEQLAEKIDVSTVFISQIETAVRKPSLETIYKISVVLNTTIDTLIGNDNENVLHGEIIKLVSGKNTEELKFIIGVLREMCSNMNEGKIVNDRRKQG